MTTAPEPGFDDHCARCRRPLHAGSEAFRCPQCGALYHEICFHRKGCVSRECGVNTGAALGVQQGNELGEHRPASPARSRRGGRDVSPGLLVLALWGTGTAAALGAAVLWFALRPAAVAQRAYDAAIAAQVAGDLEAARRGYQVALDRRPDMAEAALSLGFAWLGFRGASLRESSIQELSESAQGGRTAELDAADRAFDRCISLAAGRPADQRVQALFAATTGEMVGVAWTGRAVTALTRAAAAFSVGSGVVGDAWVAGAFSALDAADRAHPGAETAELRRIAEAIRAGR